MPRKKTNDDEASKDELRQEVMVREPHLLHPGIDSKGRYLPGVSGQTLSIPAEMARLRSELLNLTTNEHVHKMHAKLISLIDHPRPEIATHALKLSFEFLIGRPSTVQVHEVNKQVTTLSVEVTTDEMKERLRQLGMLPPALECLPDRPE